MIGFCGISIGVVTAIVSINLGYNIMSWQWWGIFALAEIPFIAGYIIGINR